jgi:hypothetical protein
MDGYRTAPRTFEAHLKSLEREALRRQKALERELKESAKLSALEQARLQVEQYQNQLDVLLTVHKDQSTPVDWLGLASCLCPHPPLFLPKHELASLLQVARQWDAPMPLREGAGSAFAAAGQRQDVHEHRLAQSAHVEDIEIWQQWRELARRVLNGDIEAYTQAINSLAGSLAEISNLGSSLGVEVFDRATAICNLMVKGRDTIPTGIMSLTAGGKLSVRPMPKAKFHEIYQDYVCSCVLRLGREVFSMLPVNTLILTASVNDDEGTVRHGEVAVLSIMVHRDEFTSLDFDHLDPSDTIEFFPHRGDVKVSRKSDSFVAVIPFTEADLPAVRSGNATVSSILGHIRRMRDEVALTCESLPKTARHSNS